GDGAAEIVLAEIAQTAVVVRIRIFFVELNNPRKVAYGAVEIAARVQQDAAVHQSIHELRLDADGFRMIGDATFEIAQPGVCLAAKVEGGGKFRIDLDGLAVAFDGSFQIAEVMTGDAIFEVGEGTFASPFGEHRQRDQTDDDGQRDPGTMTHGVVQHGQL